MVMMSYLYFLVVPTVVLSSRYDYGLFENFEIMKDAFVQEKIVTLRLKRMRMQLHNSTREISYYNFLHWHNRLNARNQYFDTPHDNRKWSSFKFKRIFCNPISKSPKMYLYAFTFICQLQIMFLYEVSLLNI